MKHSRTPRSSRSQNKGRAILAVTAAAVIAITTHTFTGRAFTTKQYEGNQLVVKAMKTLNAERPLSIGELLDITKKIKGVKGIAVSADGNSVVITDESYSRDCRTFASFNTVLFIQSDTTLRPDVVAALKNSKRRNLQCGGLFLPV